MLSPAYYVQNYANIIGTSLPLFIGHPHNTQLVEIRCLIIEDFNARNRLMPSQYIPLHDQFFNLLQIQKQ